MEHKFLDDVPVSTGLNRIEASPVIRCDYCDGSPVDPSPDVLSRYVFASQCTSPDRDIAPDASDFRCTHALYRQDSAAIRIVASQSPRMSKTSTTANTGGDRQCHYPAARAPVLAPVEGVRLLKATLAYRPNNSLNTRVSGQPPTRRHSAGNVRREGLRGLYSRRARGGSVPFVL